MMNSESIVLDSRTLDVRGEPVFKSVMDAAERLAPGQVLSVRIDFEPTLLYRLLDRKGYEHWSTPGGRGEWRVHFRRRR